MGCLLLKLRRFSTIFAANIVWATRSSETVRSMQRTSWRGLAAPACSIYTEASAIFTHPVVGDHTPLIDHGCYSVTYSRTSVQWTLTSNSQNNYSICGKFMASCSGLSSYQFWDTVEYSAWFLSTLQD